MAPGSGGWTSSPTYTFPTVTDVVLSNAETWTLLIEVTGASGGGNNTGLDSLTVNGVVPEPATLGLLAPWAILLMRRRA